MLWRSKACLSGVALFCTRAIGAIGALRISRQRRQVRDGEKEGEQDEKNHWQGETWLESKSRGRRWAHEGVVHFFFHHLPSLPTPISCTNSTPYSEHFPSLAEWRLVGPGHRAIVGVLSSSSQMAQFELEAMGTSGSFVMDRMEVEALSQNQIQSEDVDKAKGILAWVKI